MKLRRLAALLLLTGFCLPLAARADVPLMGDVTGPAGPDGKVDVTDAIRLLKTVLGQTYIFQDEFVKSDVAPLYPDGTRGDGILDIRDVLTELRWTVGLDPATPPTAPSSLYYEGIASLGFPNAGTSLVRRIAFSLRWVDKPSAPLEARAILFPGRCIGYALPTTPVQLRGIADANNQLVLEGGYVPVHPQVRFGERIQIRLKIDLTSDVTGDAAHRELLGCAYEEELRGLSPEPVVQDGRFAVTSKFIDPEPLDRLRDPLFPTKPASFQGPSAASYRRSTADATVADDASAANGVAAGFVKFAEGAKTDQQLSPFLNASPSADGLYDSVDALQAVPYDALQESSYEANPASSSAGGFPAFQNMAAHALTTALPVLRTADSSQTSDGDLLNGLRMGFLFSAEKTLEAERDIRGAEDDALFAAPLTIEQEDNVMARAITEYEDALYGTVGTLAIGPLSKTASLEANLAVSEAGVLPVLQTPGRDYRLLARILSGLSSARIEHSRRALAVQDWTRSQLECEMMVFDARYAMSLMDAQEASVAPVTIRNSQELIQTFDNITTLGNLFTSAELQETPVGTLLNRPDPTGTDDTDRLNDGGVGAITVAQYDYPQVADGGDWGLNPDPSTTLDTLIQSRINEIQGTTGTDNTLANLSAAEDALRSSLLAYGEQTLSALDRQNQDANQLEMDLIAIVGQRADIVGSPAVAQGSETPSPQNDATYAALASWDGAIADGTWVSSWVNQQGSLYSTYSQAYGLKNDILAAGQRLVLDQQKLGIIQQGLTANDQDLQNLLDIQNSSVSAIEGRASEIQSTVQSILQNSGSTSFAHTSSLLSSLTDKITDVIGSTAGKFGEDAAGLVVGKLGGDPNKGWGCYVTKGVGGAASSLAKFGVAALLGGPAGWGLAAGAAVEGGIGGALDAAQSGECSGKEHDLPPII